MPAAAPGSQTPGDHDVKAVTSQRSRPRDLRSEQAGALAGRGGESRMERRKSGLGGSEYVTEVKRKAGNKLAQRIKQFNDTSVGGLI